ncbi:MAG: hypothetical protein Q4A31_10540 [Corynebacterium sp.]|uniref:hypothetical protein n=1 Tax=Corynebacterium sp. TaxID=1720 RepID=UPI0026DD2B87|nr:hypothetical protein [Corynebacterium sp.]MDO4762345.1 hypothetical protein [Corynebacterium sp.]
MSNAHSQLLYVSQTLDDEFNALMIEYDRARLRVLSNVEESDEDIRTLSWGLKLSEATTRLYVRSVKLLRDHAPRVFAYLMDTGVFSLDKVAAIARPLLVLTPSQVEMNQEHILHAIVPKKEGQTVPQPSSLSRAVRSTMVSVIHDYPVETRKKDLNTVVVSHDRAGNTKVQLTMEPERARPWLELFEKIANKLTCRVEEAIERVLTAEPHAISSMLVCADDSDSKQRIPRKAKKRLKNYHRELFEKVA